MFYEAGMVRRFLRSLYKHIRSDSERFQGQAIKTFDFQLYESMKNEPHSNFLVLK